MTMVQAMLSFALAAGLLTITPGLDTALILRTAAVKGGRQAFGVTLGTSLGCLVWCVLVSVGLGALLLVSETLYDVIRLLGASYLLWLGLQMIAKARKPAHSVTPEAKLAPPVTEAKLSTGFYQGLLNNLLNPKVGVFYVGFLPQFIPPSTDIAHFGLILGGIHVIEGVLWGVTLIMATRPLSAWLRRPEVTCRLERLTGSVLLLFGLKLALEPRHP